MATEGNNALFRCHYSVTHEASCCRPAYAKFLRKLCNTTLLMEAKCGKGPRMLWFEDKLRGVLVVCVVCQHDNVNHKMDWIEATLRGTAAYNQQTDDSIIVDADTDTPLKVHIYNCHFCHQTALHIS